MKKNFSFIFLGMTHGFIDDFNKQKKLIKEIKPEFIFSEDMQDISLISIGDYSSFLQNKKHSLMTSFGDVEKLVSIYKEDNIKLIGIDFENFGFSEKIANKINNKEEITKEEEKEIEKLVDKREEYHIKKISNQNNLSKKPILVFLGSWHLRSEGLIVNKIKNSKIIFPANKKGEMVLEPTKDKIVYMEKNI
ncbi:hypothetical protein KAJ87_02080 [Candidatus Pacearchaeota archaeon]|nr:hypothetical protein [Candidatus Pacearchaeota archaeon]